MTDLCKLAHKYGTDKTYYTPFYSLLLEGRRKTIKRVLEIGIGTPSAMKHVANYKPGASLRMWEEYFPSAFIYGVDNEPGVLFQTNRIATFYADQARPETIRPISNLGSFDLIVDDGSHSTDHQLKTADMLLPVLSKGGLYIVEDVNEPDAFEGLQHSYVRVRHGDLTGHCVVING